MSALEGSDDSLILELRRRLEEAEETLRAIREGEVDALVVRGGREDAVFTLEGESGSYREFMEIMDPGAAAVDPDGRVLYANNSLCELLGRPVISLQGQLLAGLFDNAEIAGKIDAVVRGAEEGRNGAELSLGDETNRRHFAVSAAPLRMGVVTGRAVTFTDITERVNIAATQASELAARAIMASANEAFIVCDRDGLITNFNAAAAGAVFEGNPVGTPFAEAVPLLFPGTSNILQSDDIIEMAVAGNAIQGIEAVATSAPKGKDFLVSAAPLRVSGDKITGCVITMVDLSQRKAAEKQQLLLIGELDHRVKNTLALVLSISSRTLSHEDTLEGFQQAFTGRIQALAATHTLLAAKNWQDLSLEDVVRSELAPYVSDNYKLNIEQLNFEVTPRAAIALGLIFHELATNAVKYGALSGEEGHVTVSAEREGHPEFITVRWLERGGPEVVEPTRRGFGRTVIARSLQYSPAGGAELKFAPEGLECEIRIPRIDVPEPA